jgi:hypothetical protein
MATTTTNFGWDIPQSTDLVKDGATAIAALGQDIDTALVDLKGGTSGQVLSKASGTDLDFTWIAQDDVTLTINPQTGTTYTFSATDAINSLVSASNAAAQTYTLPLNSVTAIPTGSVINLIQVGAGQVTLQGAAGVTVASTGATSATPKLRATNSALSAIKVGTDSWYVIGDIV